MQHFIMASPSDEYLTSKGLDITKALRSWSELRNNILAEGGNVTVVGGEPDVSDLGIFLKQNMGFTVSVEGVRPRKTIVKATIAVGYENILFDESRNILWHGFNSTAQYSEKAKLDELFENTNVVVRGLPLTYGGVLLSNALNLTPNGHMLWNPEMFDEHAQYVLKSFYPRHVTLTQEDILNKSSGGIFVGTTFISGQMSNQMKNSLSNLGLGVIELDFNEWNSISFTPKSLVNQIFE